MSVMRHFIGMVYFEWDGVICFLETSSRPKVLREKGVLRDFIIFTGKHLFWSLFLIKFHAFRVVTLLKRDSNTGVFLWTLLNF